MTRMVRALVLAALGALLLVLAWWLDSRVPELTVENMDELVDDGWIRRSRVPLYPLALGVLFILASAWLLWRQILVSAVRREHPCAVVIEVSVSKEARRGLSSVFLSRSSAASYILLIRDSSISLWAGLPPRPEVFVEARDVRTFEYDEHSANGATAAQIVLEWNDGHNLRRLLVDPIGWGLRGISPPPPALTAAAVHRGRLLTGLEVATDAV